MIPTTTTLTHSKFIFSNSVPISYHQGHTGLHVLPLTCHWQFSLWPFAFAIPCVGDEFCRCICLAWFLSLLNTSLKIYLFIETFPEFPTYLITLPYFNFLLKSLFLPSIGNILLIYLVISLYPLECKFHQTREFYSFSFTVLSQMPRKVSGNFFNIQQSLLNIEWINAFPLAISRLRKYKAKERTCTRKCSEPLWNFQIFRQYLEPCEIFKCLVRASWISLHSQSRD